MASFRSEAEAFPGMSGMAEGHDRYARGLKPGALDRGVVHYFLLPIVTYIKKPSYLRFILRQLGRVRSKRTAAFGPPPYEMFGFQGISIYFFIKNCSKFYATKFFF